MDLTTLFLSITAGSAGGYIGNFLKKNNLGQTNNLVVGALGGLTLPIILGAVTPSLLSNLGNDATIVSLLVAFLGGNIGSLIGGLLKKPVS